MPKPPRILALICLLILAPLAAHAQEQSASAQLPARGVVTLVDVGAASCKPCKMMAPLLEELKGEYLGKAVVAFVDVRHDRQAVERFAIRAIPTQIFFDREGREVHRHIGFLDKTAMSAMLDKLLAAKRP